MIQNLHEELKSEHKAETTLIAQIPNLAKQLKVKVGFDEFETRISFKADQMLFDALKLKLGDILKTERFFLIMLSEVLKIMQQRPDDSVNMKNKKIGVVLDHLQAQVNSKDFNVNLQPLNGLNWEEIRIGDEEALEITETPLSRADHNSLPVS